MQTSQSFDNLDSFSNSDNFSDDYPILDVDQWNLEIDNFAEEDLSPKKQTSRAMTSFNIMKTIIGGGIFATPSAFEKCGFVFGLFLVFGLGGIFYWSILTLTKASIKSEKKTLQSLTKFCFGERGEVLLNFTLFLIAWGAMASYTVIIGDVLPDILSHAIGTEVNHPKNNVFVNAIISRRGQVILTSFFILFPVSMAKTLAPLAKYSGFALSAIFFISLSVLFVGPTLEGGPNPGKFWKGSEPISFIKFDGIPSAIGIFCFAYVCQHNILLNYCSLKNRNIRRFKQVIQFSVGSAVLLTVIIGLAYLTFRENSQSNILNSFPVDNTIISFCRFLFAFDMFFTYPLELFIARDTIQQALFRTPNISKENHLIFTILILLSTIIVGCSTCQLGMILELSGGVTASVIAFILPSACWLKVNSIIGIKLGIKERIAHLSLITFGFAVMILTFLMTIYEGFNENNPKKQCNW
ncbi:hypothetical protein HDU92_007310 [Lobulomyces angularis]|nr:hypothetical protein HDU92_007310 [Lobulomyces angularis]